MDFESPTIKKTDWKMLQKFVDRPSINMGAKAELKAIKAKKQAIEAMKGSKHKNMLRQNSNMVSLFL